MNYYFYTGDYRDEARVFIYGAEWHREEDITGLYNPIARKHVLSHWDDGGETHPFDHQGPNLYLDLKIPEGWHELSLYFIDPDWYNTEHPRHHRIKFIPSSQYMDPDPDILCILYAADFGQGLYKTVAVQGPLDLTLIVEKLDSVTANVAGVFLDPSRPPLPLPPEIYGPSRPLRPEHQAAAQEYKQLLSAHYYDTDRYYARLREAEGWMASLRKALDTEDPLVARWMLWQIQERRHEFEAANEEFTQLVAQMKAALEPDQVRELLARYTYQAFQQKDFHTAELFAREYLKVLEESGERTVLGETLKSFISEYTTIDPPFTLTLIERLVAAVAERFPKEQASEEIKGLAQAYFDRAKAVEKKKTNYTGYEDDPWYAVVEWTYQALRDHFGQESLTAEDQYRLTEAMRQREVPTPIRDAWVGLRSELIAQHVAYLKEIIAEEQRFLTFYPESRYAQGLPLRIATAQCRLAASNGDFETPLQTLSTLHGKVADMQVKLLYDLLLSEAQSVGREDVVERAREAGRALSREAEGGQSTKPGESAVTGS
jgi:hypothetical protein